MFLAGAKVSAGRGQLAIRGLTPIPALLKGFRLHPDDDGDPYAFRIDGSPFSLGTFPVVFSYEPETGAARVHLGPTSLEKQPETRHLKRWLAGACVVGAAALAARGLRGRTR